MSKIIKEWQEKGEPIGLRLGQYFVGTYVKEPWTELYYEENFDAAITMINNWLKDKQYFNTLPPRLTGE